MGQTDSNPEADMELVSEVIASKYRKQVGKALQDGPKTPSRIADYYNDATDMAHISRALQQLREGGVVDLLVPDDRKKGRIYGLTERGEAVVERAFEVAVEPTVPDPDIPLDAEHHNAPKDGNDDPVLPDAAQGEPARCPECDGALTDTLGGLACPECGWAEDGS